MLFLQDYSTSALLFAPEVLINCASCVQKWSNLQAVHHDDVVELGVTFEKEEITLNIDSDGTEVEGWKITPIIPPRVSAYFASYYNLVRPLTITI